MLTITPAKAKQLTDLRNGGATFEELEAAVAAMKRRLADDDGDGTIWGALAEIARPMAAVTTLMVDILDHHPETLFDHLTEHGLTQRDFI